MTPAALALLAEAYEHYRKTDNMRFHIIFKNKDYLFNAISSVEELERNGYIGNLSDELIDKILPKSRITINITPPEELSFDITFKGIEFIKQIDGQR